VSREAASRRLSVEFLQTEWVCALGADTSDAVDKTLEEAKECDGLLLFSAVFSDALSGLARLVQHWLPRPIVSLGSHLPGVDSVLLDNLGGVQAATQHLIIEHDRRKIVFIRGRRDSQEAEKRYLGYRRGLHGQKILYDARKVIQGNFTAEGAVAALSKLPKAVEYDAIIASNDDMALGVIDFLMGRGIKVPQDVAIIGFDDVPEARNATVPLSSLAQPFEDLAKESLDLLTATFRNDRNGIQKSVPVILKPRASCGCLGR
jgi:LacI family transcriptional regulator